MNEIPLSIKKKKKKKKKKKLVVTDYINQLFLVLACLSDLFLAQNGSLGK
jgi:hypothetical protein